MAKTIFISYSHDNAEHMAWVKKFADDLKSKGGITVLLDQDAPKGMSLTRFMELGIEMAERVLVIGTENYKSKSMKGGGVAFEESIISSDFLNDIDSTKYYPILRSGTFKESFPPILSSRNGDDMSDDSKYEEMLKVIIEEINNPGISPINKLLHDQKAIEPIKVHFGVNILFETMFEQPTGRIEGIAFRVDITNTSKEPRYVNAPSFELSDYYDGFNAFQLNNVIGNRYNFPVKLEFGQVLTQVYMLNRANVEMFKKMLADVPTITIQAVGSTTIEEVVKAEPYALTELQKDFKYIR